MLLERNQVIIGLVVMVVLAIGTAFAVGASGGMFKPGEEVQAEFADAAGLGSGDFVFVAGVRVGEVLDVTIDGDIARATFTVTSDGVPADSGAAIFVRNTLGKRAIRLEPGDSSEYLTGGDVIPVDRTTTPVDLPELGDRSAELLGQVNVDALQDLVTALADVTEGNREDVTALLDGLDKVTAVVSDRKEELGSLIDRAEVLIDAAADKDQDIVRIIDAFGSTLDRLAARRDDITRLLRETASTTDITADLIADRRTQLDRILGELDQDLQIVDDHQVDLAHALAYAGVGVRGFSSIAYQGGPAKADTPGWGNVFVTGLGEAGVQALLGCGGTLDDALTQLLGPDPNCEDSGAVAGNAGGGDGGQDGGAAVPEPFGGIDRIFQLRGVTR